MTARLLCAATGLVFWLLAGRLAAHERAAPGPPSDPAAGAETSESHDGHPGARPTPAAAGTTAVAGPRWPSPVADDALFSMVLLDLLEYERLDSVDAGRWDLVGWWGSDRRRFWLKSEGTLYDGRPSGGQWGIQALYGKLISPFFDLQLGLAVEQRREVAADPTRAFAVIGVQGLAPYRIEVEPALLVSNKGKLSGRLTATFDTLITQRLILQSRFETEFAAQRDAGFGVDRGVNDAELGVRLRYEVRRELAPYVGLSYRRSFGASRARAPRGGSNKQDVQVVVGLRAWL